MADESDPPQPFPRGSLSDERRRQLAAEFRERFQSIRGPSTAPSREKDERSRQETQWLKGEKKKLELQHREDEARVRGIEQDQRDRKRYTGRIFWLMLGWMIIVLLLVAATGVNSPDPATPRLPIPTVDWVSIALLAAVLSLGLGQVVNLGVAQRFADAAREAGWRSWAGFAAWILVPVVVMTIVAIRSTSPAQNPVSMSAWIVAFDLSETVILALIGSTTANVIGLFVIVVSYLFRRKKAEEDSRKRRLR